MRCEIRRRWLAVVGGLLLLLVPLSATADQDPGGIIFGYARTQVVVDGEERGVVLDLYTRAPDGIYSVWVAATTTREDAYYEFTPAGGKSYRVKAWAPGHLWTYSAPFDLPFAGWFEVSVLTVLFGDGDHDGDVDIYDVNRLTANWLKRAPN